MTAGRRPGSQGRGRLYVQIYLAFLMVALLSAVAAAGVAWLVAGDRWAGVPPPIRAATDQLAKQLEDDPKALHVRAAELGLMLTLRGPDGRLVDHAGPALGDRVPRSEGWGRWRRHRLMSVKLPDGRWLTGALAKPRTKHGPPRHLALLAVLLLAAAAGCYPLARRLTRRLEALQAQVRQFGEGDLSARAAAGGDRRRHRDEVTDLALAFNSAADRIQALIAGERRMLASASHELRAPLARLRMAVELLDDPELPPDRRTELSEASVQDIAELDALVEELLQSARLRDAPSADRRSPVNLTALVSAEADRAGETCSFGPDSPPPRGLMVRGDERALRRMVRNLIDNATRHAGTNVELAMASSGAAITLTVSDRGPGIPEAEAEAIWQPFYRPAGHREGIDGGVGLGLAIVREIAESHDGAATHAPRPGGGATFTITLPSPD